MNEFNENDHPRADDGKFTNGNGSRTRLIHSDLDKALSALNEVDKGITLTRQEHSALRAEVMRKNAAQKEKVKPVNFAFNADHFYVYSTNGDDSFTPLTQLDIEADREKISDIMRRLQ